MLEANPSLGWRDVQGILAATAQQVELTDDSWTTNAAGIRHSSKYGFGIVDASAAVTAARTWERWGTETPILGESDALNITIPDNPPGSTILQQLESTMKVEDNRNLTTESVVVFLELTHASSGDLEISLTMPGGIKSILSPGNRPVTWQPEEDARWKFLTYSAWGTPPQGDWTLTIVDQSPGIIRDCQDYEWTFEQDGSTYLCSNFDDATDCTNPDQVPDQSLVLGTFEGRTALDACCACGGGVDLRTIPNELKSWRMLIYTHDNDEVVTSPPTVSPAPTSISPRPTPVGNTTIPPGGIPVPTGPPVPLAPVPFTQAIVMTIPPNVTNLPFVTNGGRSGTNAVRGSTWSRIGATSSLSMLLLCLVQLLW